MTNKTIGFYEGKISYSFIVQFKELKNGTKKVYLRPSINILNNNIEDLTLFKKIVGIENNSILGLSVDGKISYNYKRVSFQTMDAAAKIISVYKKHNFYSDKVKKSFDRFCACYDFVKEIGIKHTIYTPDLATFIQMREVINRTPNIPKAKAFLARIRDFLS